MRRNISADDPNTVCVWVCQVRGTKTEIGARADEQLAKAWIERRIDADTTEWRGDRGKQFYANDSPDRGIIELVPVHDAVAILIEEP